jgi:DNA mismatch endonuclease, patch repair protein
MGSPRMTQTRMADTMSIAQRRRIMQAVGTKDTGPEMKVRRWLHGKGYRYRLHSANLPGRPDLVFASRRKVIFVHGCFWHAHENCPLATLPKSKPEFWLPKLKGNAMRDRRKEEALRAQGWGVLVVWQCELRDIERLGVRMVSFLGE